MSQGLRRTHAVERPWERGCVLARSRSCVCPDVVIPGGNGGGGGGECEKNIELRAHNLQAFYSGSENAKYTNTSRRNQVSMALFLFANIH